jgi:hypothetical protein
VEKNDDILTDLDIFSTLMTKNVFLVCRLPARLDVCVNYVRMCATLVPEQDSSHTILSIQGFIHPRSVPDESERSSFMPGTLQNGTKTQNGNSLKNSCNDLD